jgi:hypothetical protein
MSVLLAVDDGIAQGNNNVADIFFLIAAILFGIGAFIAYSVKTFYATLIAAGLTFIAIAWLLL